MSSVYKFLTLRIILPVLISIGLFIFCHGITYALTTSYKSAGIITTDGSPSYTNLSNCTSTDGLTCDRALSLNYANLYFRDFGDFGIPQGATITGVRIRINGMSSIGLYVGASSGTSYELNCQSPGDKWTTTVLVGTSIKTYEVISTTGVDFTYCLNSENIRNNNFIWRINRAGPVAWSANIDNFEVAFDYTPGVTPTPTPTPTPEPPPAPFLELPWDYQGNNMSFNESALNINSYLDHEYPLLSSGLGESIEAQNSLIYFRNGRRNFNYKYSSHDGYDYGLPANVGYGDAVLAAASGWATFDNSCSACGNAILIDHENGYQTRYYHLEPSGLITTIPGQRVYVTVGTQIGKVGATGNVQPSGEAGAHLHFMVIKDKNNDGNFNDNIPDGITDPFGWQSTSPDPWENYSFYYSGQNRNGAKSYYLWKKQIDNLNVNLSANGGIFTSGRNTLNFPSGATSDNLILKIISSPSQKISDIVSSVGSTVEVLAEDALGNPVTVFNSPFTIGINFTGFDLTKYLIDSLSIYSSSDGINWTKENTTIDMNNQTATADVNHLTHFALMADRLDSVSGSTSVKLLGSMGQQNWFRSSVSAILSAEDNIGGLGIDHIFYKLGENDWQEYINPIDFTEEGKFGVSFYSIDKDGNIENQKNIAFTIDKTPPELDIYYSILNKDFQFDGMDGTESAEVIKTDFSGNKNIIAIDKAGNSLSMNIKNSLGSTSTINLLSLQYNSSPVTALSRNPILTTKLSYYKRTTQLTSIGQTYSENGKNIIGATYSYYSNTTKIYTYSRNKAVLKEELPGMRLLKLSTEKATLNYSY